MKSLHRYSDNGMGFSYLVWNLYERMVQAQNPPPPPTAHHVKKSVAGFLTIILQTALEKYFFKDVLQCRGLSLPALWFNILYDTVQHYIRLFDLFRNPRDDLSLYICNTKLLHHM
jgi:hypothetical protein